MNKSTKSFMSKLLMILFSFAIACTLFLSVSSVDGEDKGGVSFSSSTEGVYVIENIGIDYRYDKTKYEVVPFVTEPYVVIKGDKKLINLLKWGKKPEFFIELSGKTPGTYQESVQYTGINSKLDVQVYPSMVDLRIMEQQTISIVPIIEYTGTENVNTNYIVSAPVLLKDNVKIRDIQDKLNQVGNIKGVIDVSSLTKTQELTVDLVVYDRDGNIMSDINLIDKSINVKVQVDKKVTIVKEEVIQNIVVVEEVKPDEKTPVQEGKLSFTNIPTGMEVTNTTGEVNWSGDIKINLSGFEAGKYEMTVDDKGVKKTVKFVLTNPTSSSTTTSSSSNSDKESQ